MEMAFGIKETLLSAGANQLISLRGHMPKARRNEWLPCFLPSQSAANCHDQIVVSIAPIPTGPSKRESH